MAAAKDEQSADEGATVLSALVHVTTGHPVKQASVVTRLLSDECVTLLLEEVKDDATGTVAMLIS